MAVDKVKLDFRPGTWSRQVVDDLRTVASHTERDLIAFRTMVARGEMDVLEIWHGNARAGCVIWSVVHEIGRRVLVINAVAARPIDGVQVAVMVRDHFASFGQLLGCRALRCWTKRAGLVRVLENAGSATAAYVIEEEI